MSDSLAAFDTTFRAAFPGLDGLEGLVRHDAAAAARWSARFLALPEILDPRALHADGSRLDRRQAAVRILYANTAALTAEELAQAIRVGALVIDAGAPYDRARGAILWDHPDLRTPDRRFAALLVALEPGEVNHASTLIAWLCHRLTEEPHVPGMSRLLELHRASRRFSDVLGAAGDRSVWEELAADLGTEREDAGVVASVFALDPTKAFDVLGGRLDDAQRRRHVVEVLAQDGFRTHPLAGHPSTRPQGWVRADPRWIPGLLRLRDDADAMIALHAAEALGHADLDAVLSLLPAPKKRIPPLELVAVGDVATASADAAWLGREHLVVADGPTSLAVYGLAPSLALRARVALPEGVTLPVSDSSDDAPWEAVGLHDVAVGADGALVLCARTATGEDVLALFDPRGQPVAQVTFTETGPRHPHRLAFGAGGRGALFVALVDEAEHVVRAYGPALSPLADAKLGVEFPLPATFTPFAHPTDDAVGFLVSCGQDGVWLPVVARASLPKLQKHKLSGKQAELDLLGLAPTVAVFGRRRQLVLRPWPELGTPKKKVLDGVVVAGCIDGEHVALAIAEVSRAPSALELRRVSDGERIAKGRYPIGEPLVALGHGFLVTEAGARLNVRRLAAK